MLGAAILLSMATAGLAANYAVVPILAPSGFTGVSMIGINNSGQVAGYGNIGGTTQAFVSSTIGGAVIPLPPGWTSANGVAINASGQVAGTVSKMGGIQAFIGTAAGSTLIPSPSGPNEFGYAVNDSGQVAGALVNMRAFIGTTSGSVFLPFPAGFGGGALLVTVAGVNNSGQVAGSVTFLSSQAFIGTPAGTTTIPLPLGWGQTFSQAINDSGQVAGTGNGNGQAFIGTVTGSTAIPLPSGATYVTLTHGSLNNSGVVVGQSDAGGWIWDATNGTRLLNSFVPPGWNVTTGISISNNGLILAQASYQGGASQYVELVPAGLPGTPAPSTLVLVLIGMIGCWIGSRYWRAASQS